MRHSQHCCCFHTTRCAHAGSPGSRIATINVRTVTVMRHSLRHTGSAMLSRHRQRERRHDGACAHWLHAAVALVR
jgi:hypothetical protein